MSKLLKAKWARAALVLLVFAGMIAFFIWHGPKWGLVLDAFRFVAWEWVVAAIALNLLSVVARAAAWNQVIEQAVPPPQPPFRAVFSAFGVGLFANAVLPGRIGELARVAVLSRRIEEERRADTWAVLLGTVFAHRVLDLFPVVLLIGYVAATAKIPHWAVASLIVFLIVAFALFGFALASARHRNRTVLEDAEGGIRRLITMARYGLGVLHAPVAAVSAALLQCLGWLCQLFAVWASMRAFDIHEPLPAAGLVLLLMNVAMVTGRTDDRLLTREVGPLGERAGGDRHRIANHRRRWRERSATHEWALARHKSDVVAGRPADRLRAQTAQRQRGNVDDPRPRRRLCPLDRDNVVVRGPQRNSVVARRGVDRLHASAMVEHRPQLRSRRRHGHVLDLRRLQ